MYPSISRVWEKHWDMHIDLLRQKVKSQTPKPSKVTAYLGTGAYACSPSTQEAKAAAVSSKPALTELEPDVNTKQQTSKVCQKFPLARLKKHWARWSEAGWGTLCVI